MTTLSDLPRELRDMLMHTCTYASAAALGFASTAFYATYRSSQDMRVQNQWGVCGRRRWIVAEAVRDGNMAFAEEMMRATRGPHFSQTRDEIGELTEAAAGAPGVLAVRWLHAHGLLTPMRCAHHAIATDRLDVIDVLHSIYPGLIAEYLDESEQSPEYISPSVVAHLLSKVDPEKHLHKIPITLGLSGHIAFIQSHVAQIFPLAMGQPVRVVNLGRMFLAAASNGHTALIQHLFNKCPIVMSSPSDVQSFMGDAFKNGHIDTFKWLHGIVHGRPEIITNAFREHLVTNAIFRRARASLAWAIDQEWIEPRHLASAIELGVESIVQLIRTRCGLPWPEDACFLACRGNSYSMLVAAHSEGDCPLASDSRILREAIRHGNVTIVNYLLARGIDPTVDNLMDVLLPCHPDSVTIATRLWKTYGNQLIVTGNEFVHKPDWAYRVNAAALVACAPFDSRDAIRRGIAATNALTERPPIVSYAMEYCTIGTLHALCDIYPILRKAAKHPSFLTKAMDKNNLPLLEYLVELGRVTDDAWQCDQLLTHYMGTQGDVGGHILDYLIALTGKAAVMDHLNALKESDPDHVLTNMDARNWRQLIERGIVYDEMFFYMDTTHEMMRVVDEPYFQQHCVPHLVHRNGESSDEARWRVYSGHSA